MHKTWETLLLEKNFHKRPHVDRCSYVTGSRSKSRVYVWTIYVDTEEMFWVSGESRSFYEFWLSI